MSTRLAASMLVGDRDQRLRWLVGSRICPINEWLGIDTREPESHGSDA